MRKVCKIILIVLFYVLMFWGLGSGIKSALHKTNKCNCTCDEAEKVVGVIKEEPNQKLEVEITENKKEEPKKEEKKESVINNTTNVAPKVTGTKAEYQTYAYDLVLNSYLWSEEDYQALVKLWTKESDWSANAHNKSSGAHGIPQSLPANKMASEGSDYYTNGYTQIRWGLKYIKERYGTPSEAWKHFQNKNWY